MHKHWSHLLVAISAALFVSGCAGGEALMNFGGSVFMAASSGPYTYRMTVEGIALKAQDLAGLEFPINYGANIYVDEIKGLEKLKRNRALELVEGDADNVQRAMVETLRLAGLQCPTPSEARYRLGIAITDRTSEGIWTQTSSIAMTARLLDAATGGVILERSFSATSSAKPDPEEWKYPLPPRDIVWKAVGKAMEGAIREDFKELIYSLARNDPESLR